MAVEGASVRHILLSYITFPQGNHLKHLSQCFFLLRFVFADLSSIGWFRLKLHHSLKLQSMFKPLTSWGEKKRYLSFFRILMEWHCCYCDTFHIKRENEFLRCEKCNILPLFAGQESDVNTSLEKPKGGKLFWLFCSDVNAFTSFQLDTVKPYNIQKKTQKTSKPNESPPKT